MKKKTILFYTFICFVLFYCIILYNNHYIEESFQANVDLPINTWYSCSNFCGPNAECAITRDQCSSDNTCPGCKPIDTSPKYKSNQVSGADDAGKLTFSQTPQYSELTSDMGTKASIYNDKFSKVPQIYWGIDRWTKSANQGMNYFLKNQQNNDDALKYDFEFKPHYPSRDSITGLYIDKGPLSSNAYITN